MAGVRDSIELNDLFSPIIHQVANSVSYAITAMEQMQKAMNAPMDTSALDSARANADMLNNSLRQFDEAAKQADKAMKGAEEAAKGLGSGFEESSEECKKMSNGFVNAADGINNLFMAFGGYKILGVVKTAFSEASSAAIEFESAVTGVYKTVEGTPEQLEQLSDSVKRMATEIPASVTEIAGVMESAGQLGIETESVENFSRVMIDLGNSTNLTSDAAASALAQFANVTKMDPSQYSNLGSAIVDLGNNFATTEADIVGMSSYLASAASLAGFSQSDILGLSTAMQSVGISAEAGGSSMSRLITQMQLAVETGDGLEQFASVAGMSMQQFSDTFENDGVGALEAFITGLNDVERNGTSTSAILQQMGLDDIRLSNTIKSLASNSGLLTNAVRTAGDAWSENSALANEANKRYATLESKLQMTKNSANNLKIAIGDSLNPVVGNLAGAAASAMGGLAGLAEEFPSLTAGVVGFGGTITTAVGGIAAIAPTATVAITAVGQLKDKFNITGSALGTFAGKAGLVLAGIGVLVGVGSALYTSFSKADQAVENYNGTLEQCRKEIDDTTLAYKNVCDMYGESHEAAKQLEGQLNTLHAQYEKGGGVVADYAQRLEESRDELISLADEYNDKIKSTEAEGINGMVAVAQLEALSDQAEITNTDLDMMSKYADYLNDTFNCNIQVNYSTGELTGFDPDDIVRKRGGLIAKIALENKKQAALDYVMGDKFVEGYTNAYKNWKDSKNESKKVSEVFSKQNAGSVVGLFETAKASVEIESVRKLEEWREEVQKAFVDIGGSEAAQDYMDQLEMAADAYNNIAESADNAASSAVEMTEAMTPHEMAATVWNNQSEAIKKFAEAYSEAYNSARSSLDGMFGLFEKVEMSLENTVSPDDALEAWKSQMSYIEQYGDAINELSQLGLDNNIVSRLDPQQAVAFVKAFEEMDDSDVAQKIQGMNDSVKKLSETKDKVAETMVGVDEEINQKWGEIQRNMDTNLNKLTENMDVSDGAVQAAKNVMGSYARELWDSGGGAIETVQGIADRVSSILASAGGSISVDVSASSPAVTTAAKGSNPTTTTTAVFGHAAGTTNSEDIFIAGEEGPELIIGKPGSTVFPTSETNRIISAITGTDNSNYAAESAAVYNAANTEIINNYSDMRTYNENLSQIIDLSAMDRIINGYRMQNVENYGDTLTQNTYSNDYRRSKIEMINLSGTDKKFSVGTDNMSENSTKNINITINGDKPITVNSHENISKEEILEIMLEYAEPVFANIISTVIFEEGDNSYVY